MVPLEVYTCATVNRMCSRAGRAPLCAAVSSRHPVGAVPKFWPVVLYQYCTHSVFFSWPSKATTHIAYVRATSLYHCPKTSRNAALTWSSLGSPMRTSLGSGPRSCTRRCANRSGCVHHQWLIPTTYAMAAPARSPCSKVASAVARWLPRSVNKTATTAAERAENLRDEQQRRHRHRPVQHRPPRLFRGGGGRRRRAAAERRLRGGRGPQRAAFGGGGDGAPALLGRPEEQQPQGRGGGVHRG